MPLLSEGKCDLGLREHSWLEFDQPRALQGDSEESGPIFNAGASFCNLSSLERNTCRRFDMETRKVLCVAQQRLHSTPHAL